MDEEDTTIQDPYSIHVCGESPPGAENRRHRVLRKSFDCNEWHCRSCLAFQFTEVYNYFEHNKVVILTERGPMNASSRMRIWVETHSDVVWDLVRMYLGIGLFLKAIFYLSHRDYLNQLMDETGTAWFAPVIMAHYVILAHLFGGLLLALGLLTRVAALIQIPVLFAAVFYIYLPKAMFLEPRQNLEFSALVLFLLLVAAAFGAGRWSLDHYLSRKINADAYRSEDPLPSHAH